MKIVATGYPRWRPLLESTYRHQATDGGTARILLFAPTHRANGLENYDAAKIAGFEAFKQTCDDLGIKFLARAHFSQQGQLVGAARTHSADTVDETIDDVSDLLPRVDVLITDYSSIFYDYSLFKDQVAFLAPDLPAYESRDQGMLVDYQREVPGPVFENWMEVAEWLREGLPVPETSLSAFRHAHGQYADDGIDARIIKSILELVGESRRVSHPTRPSSRRQATESLVHGNVDG